MKRVKRIGLFGGTFNPVHIGHLAAAEVVASKLKLDKVIFIPCNKPPHKEISDLVNARHRLEMVKRAIAGNSRFSVSDFEIKQKGISYSIHTVRYFQKLFPKSNLYFVMGVDALATLSKWKDIREVLKIVSFVAVRRGGYKIPKVKYPVKIITMPELDISSSFLREHIFKDKVAEYLLPKTVLKYIHQHKLYR